jgi:membrane fusion protein (multidrug efflux system)
MSSVSNESMPAPAAVPKPTLVSVSDPADAASEKQGKGLKRLLIVAALFVVALAGFLVYQYLTAGEQDTDDAMVEADVVPISVRVSGQVLRLQVEENAHVNKGDVIAELDRLELASRVKQAEGELAAAQAQAESADAEQRVAEASARGGLSSARAQVATARAQVGSAAVQIEAARAERARAEVEASKAQADLARARTLLSTGAISQETLDNAVATADAANAALAAATAQLKNSEESLQIAHGRVAEAGGALDANAPLDAKIAVAHSAAELAHARVVSAQANLELARLMLSYTTITAPSSGTVSRITLREGQLVSAGQAVASLVPDTTYVVANFKETQVAHMKPGQKVDIEVDALPGEKLHGRVESIAGATGSRFSMLPADNASGNFVKVVQRVPVRIRWEESKVPEAVRAGMSVVALVHTD